MNSNNNNNTHNNTHNSNNNNNSTQNNNNTQNTQNNNNNSIKTMWNIKDDSLQPLSPFFPPLNPQCTGYVMQSSPSCVAERICAHLKKKSIVVDYNNELCNASCMTVDRVSFHINLYQGSNADTVIVEVMRKRGDIMSFHRHTRAIINEAQGKETASRMPKAIVSSTLEFPRLMLCSERPNAIAVTKRRARSIESAVERSVDLLQKDRIEARWLGMESLVALTDIHTSGMHVSAHTSSLILGGMANDCSTTKSATPAWRTLVGFIQSDEPNEEVLHSLALRVLVNAFTVLSEHDPSSLERGLTNKACFALYCSLVEQAFSYSSTTHTAHDMALAVRSLRLMASHSTQTMENLTALDMDSSILLNKASQHAFLQTETNQVVALLSNSQIIVCSN